MHALGDGDTLGNPIKLINTNSEQIAANFEHQPGLLLAETSKTKT